MNRALIAHPRLASFLVGFWRDGDQCPQGIVYRFGVGKIFTHIRRKNHRAFLQVEILHDGCAIFFVDGDGMSLMICRRMFAPHAAAEIILGAHFIDFFGFI